MLLPAKAVAVADAAINAVPLFEQHGQQSLADITVGAGEEYLHACINKAWLKMLARGKATSVYAHHPEGWDKIESPLDGLEV